MELPVEIYFKIITECSQHVDSAQFTNFKMFDTLNLPFAISIF